MPVAEETGPESFLKTYESLKNQSYPFWELVVVFDEVDFVDSPLISEITQVKDKKVRIIKSESLFSDAAKKNFGFIKAVGNYVGVLNSGEILNPSLLFHFAVEIQKTASDLLYCNEVIEEEKSEKLFSKLEYSYLSLLNQNYVGRLWVLRKELIHSFDESCPALHEHLFLIHLARLNSNWRLVPIYGVRRIANESPKVSDHEYGKLLEGLNASGLTCHVLKNETDWNVLPDASVAVQAKVSVLVCFKDKADWTQKALENFKRFAGNVPFEAILINNQSKPSELQKLKDFLSTAEIAHTLVDYTHPFNFGHMHNWAIENYAKGEFLFLLNNDVFLKDEDRLKEMLGWVALPYVGTVGCLLRYQDGRIQHAGLTAHLGGESRLVRIGNEQNAEGFSHCTREVFGNTFAACLMKRSTYENLGGFRELDLANGFGDVAFNLECQKAGLKNIHLGYLEGVHLESASRGMNYEYWEECILEREYPELLQKMARYDLGFNRMPLTSSALRDLKTYAKGKARKSLPWLKDLKSSYIQFKMGMRHSQKTADR